MATKESQLPRIISSLIRILLQILISVEKILALLIFTGILFDTLGLPHYYNIINNTLWRCILKAESFVSVLRTSFPVEDAHTSFEPISAIFGCIGITDFSVALFLELYSEKYSGILMRDVLHHFFPHHFIAQFIMHPAFALMGIYSSQMGLLYYTGLCTFGMILSITYSFALSRCLIPLSKKGNHFIALYAEQTLLCGKFSEKKTQNLFQYIAYLQNEWKTDRSAHNFQTNELRPNTTFLHLTEETLLLKYIRKWMNGRLEDQLAHLRLEKQELQNSEAISKNIKQKSEEENLALVKCNADMETVSRLLKKYTLDTDRKTEDIGSYCLDIIIGSRQQQESTTQTDEDRTNRLLSLRLLALHPHPNSSDCSQNTGHKLGNLGLLYNWQCHMFSIHIMTCGDLWRALLGEKYFEPWQADLTYRILIDAVQNGSNCDLIVYGLVNFLNLTAPELFDNSDENDKVKSYLMLRRDFLDQIYRTYMRYANQYSKLDQEVQNRFEQIWFQIMYLAAAEVMWSYKTNQHTNNACKGFTDFCLQICKKLPMSARMDVPHQQASIGAAFIEFYYTRRTGYEFTMYLEHLNAYNYLSLLLSMEEDLKITGRPS